VRYGELTARLYTLIGGQDAVNVHWTGSPGHLTSQTNHKPRLCNSKMPITGALSPEEMAVVDHSDRKNMLLSAHWSLAAFASVFLALRVYIKFSFKKGLWWDDWFLLAGWVSPYSFPFLPASFSSRKQTNTKPS